jgi:hypothetical protein
MRMHGMEHFEIKVRSIYQADILKHDHYVINILKTSLAKNSILILRTVRNQ